MVSERLQKVLARGGVASRRTAEGLITAGRVRVNGVVVTELGAKADPFSDKVEVDGRRVIAELPVYAVLHKPRGVMSTLDDPEGRPTVKDYTAGLAGRVYPIGRLDFATSGVLLLTNDGAFADGLLHPRRTVPKTYVVKVHGVMAERDLERWRSGIDLDDGKTAPAEATLLRHEGDKTWFELTITEGRNQQIRRMGDATSFRVMRLARLSFATITAEDLKPGDWRTLTREELVTLKASYGVPKKIGTQKASSGGASVAPARRSPPRTAERTNRFQSNDDARSRDRDTSRRPPARGDRMAARSGGRRSAPVESTRHPRGEMPDRPALQSPTRGHAGRGGSHAAGSFAGRRAEPRSDLGRSPSRGGDAPRHARRGHAERAARPGGADGGADGGPRFERPAPRGPKPLPRSPRPPGAPPGRVTRSGSHEDRSSASRAPRHDASRGVVPPPRAVRNARYRAQAQQSNRGPEGAEPSAAGRHRKTASRPKSGR